jgi:hypothetical protein
LSGEHHLILDEDTSAADQRVTPTRDADATRIRAVVPRPYLLILGHGKSGSKRLLRLFDVSEWTHCRCEPNELPRSPFRRLWSAHVGGARQEAELEACWDDAVSWASARMGGRDSLPSPRKAFFGGLGYRVGIDRLFKYRRARSLVGLVVPSMRGAEWTVPAWLSDADAFRRALTVLKLGPAPAWAPWVMRNRPEAKVVHVVRHPGGFLHAYRARWLANTDEELTARANRLRLRTIVRDEPAWAPVFGDIDAMNASEAELWFWRYSTETTQRAGGGQSRFRLVRDEDVVARPLEVVRSLYAWSGLRVTEQVEGYVGRMAAQWRDRSAPWRRMLDLADVALVERVLEGSVMHDWWDRDQVVSRCDYVAY